MQTLIGHYWNRWRREYLSKLCELHKHTNIISDHQIKLNPAVIIEETHITRSRWKIGQAVEFSTSNYGFNCGCKLCMTDKMNPLEIRNSDNSVVKDSSENDDAIDDGRANRPKRLAAERGTLI